MGALLEGEFRGLDRFFGGKQPPIESITKGWRKGWMSRLLLNGLGACIKKGRLPVVHFIPFLVMGSGPQREEKGGDTGKKINVSSVGKNPLG